MDSANQRLLQRLPICLEVQKDVCVKKEKSLGKSVSSAAVMGYSKLESRGRCYLFFALFMLNLCGSVAAFMVGGWLLFTSQFSYSSAMSIVAFDNHVNHKMPYSDSQGWIIDKVYLILLIIGIFVVELSFYMLYTACEIMVLICSKKIPEGKYKNYIEDEWKSATEDDPRPKYYRMA